MKILNDQNKELRYYFKLIKECGGFKPFDLNGKRKMIRLVDMDEEEKKDKENFDAIMATKGIQSGNNENKLGKNVNNNADVKASGENNNKDGIIKKDDVLEEEISLFQQGRVGPMMM